MTGIFLNDVKNWTYTLCRKDGSMKKFFIVFISFLVILTVTSTVFYKKSAGTEAIYTEVKQSMEESEKKAQKRQDVLAKVSKELKNQEYNVSVSLSDSSFFVQAQDEDFLKKNQNEIERLILK